MYDFKQLSPADFEELTRDLLQRKLRIVLESFKSGRDQGIDLRYSTDHTQGLIVQCKHFAGSSMSRLLSELGGSELPKVTALAPDRYILVTSLQLNPADKLKIKQCFHPHILTSGDIVGANDLNNLLRLYPDVETSHFKLWLSSAAVLNRVIHNAERVQTDFDVDRVRKNIPLYVQSSNYNAALQILTERHVVIISGVPGIGKTTLADLLLFAHLEAGYEPVVIKTDIREGRKLFNKESKQVFYFDDFLGETFLGNRSDFQGKREDSAILEFMELVGQAKNTFLILTTREHILQHAFQISERFQREKKFLADRRCVLDLAMYGLLDRARILYNHIYFSDLPGSFKDRLLEDAFYMKILKHRNFNPRLIEWLSKAVNVGAVSATAYCDEVERVLESPGQLWRIAFEQQISEAARSILLALYSLGGKVTLTRLEEAWRALHISRVAHRRLPTSAEDWKRSLKELDGGFISIVLPKFSSETSSEVIFVNPSVKDFLDSKLTDDIEHLQDVVQASIFFEQIVNVWSLLASEKLAWPPEQFKRFPAHALPVAENLLMRPRFETIEIEGFPSRVREVDVGFEIRLKTLLSVADRCQSYETLELAKSFAGSLIGMWKSGKMDCSEAVAILRTVDSAKWHAAKNFSRQKDLKQAIFVGLYDGCGSGDLLELAEYAGGQNSIWTEEDQATLVRLFEGYLEHTFNAELSDSFGERQLEDFGNVLDVIAIACSYDISLFQLEISERITEIEPPDDDYDSRAHQWKGDQGNSKPDWVVEKEIGQLFDGLRPPRP